ncbi:MAG: hypothetical protein LH473_13940 [Chitinophagales bacterium]|nr:hypothetical protein [Chitinophagales bacterium]
MKFFFTKPFLLILFLILPATKLFADGFVWKNLLTAASFQPVFINDTAAVHQLVLSKQEIKIDVFPGYAAVRIEMLFINSTDKNIDLSVGFPLCNADSNSKTDCRNLYWVRLSISGALAIAPQLSYSNDSSNQMLFNTKNQKLNWQYWNIHFQPGATQMVLNYGIKTSDVQLQTNAKPIEGNGFQFSFLPDNFWNSKNCEKKIWLRMNGGLLTADIMGLRPDSTFLAGNSIVYGDLSNEKNDLIFWYRKTSDFKTSSVSWEMKYAKLKSWVVNEKIIATLTSFSASDWEGKKFEKQQSDVAKVKWLNWAIGGMLVLIAAGLVFL